MAMANASKSRIRYLFNSMLSLVAIIAVSVLFAILSFRYSLQADLTHTGSHTLTTASITVLDQLPEQLNVTAYAREHAELREDIENFISKYRRVKPNISLNFINPDGIPNEIRNLGITVNGEMLLRYQGRTEHVQKTSENDFSNALIRLAKNSERWIVFIEGHGERNPLGKANHDLGVWTQQMGHSGFTLQPLNLAEVTIIPDNTSVLVLTSPLVALLPGEIQMLLQYLDNGGNMLWLVDPDNNEHLAFVADRLGIIMEQGTVIDKSAEITGLDDPGITVITESLYGKHPALRDLKFTAYFPGSLSLKPGSNNKWMTRSLLTTANHTWLERGDLTSNIRFDEHVDLKGPLVIGLSLERDIVDKNDTAISRRIIVVGDGDFLSNTYVNNSGNMELGNRLVSWLSHDDNLIDIPIAVPADTQLTTSPLVLGIIGIVFLIILPSLFLAAGLFIRWRRNRY